MSATYQRMFVLLNTPVGLFAGGCDGIGQIQWIRGYLNYFFLECNLWSLSNFNIEFQV